MITKWVRVWRAVPAGFGVWVKGKELERYPNYFGTEEFAQEWLRIINRNNCQEITEFAERRGDEWK